MVHGAETADDKRKRVIEVALREFAEHGYARASTNAITEAAGVSKGLLFHYFGSKKELYLDVLRYCVAHATEWAAQRRQVEKPAADLMERLLESGVRKLRYAVEHPVESKVVIDAFTETPPALKAEIAALGESIRPVAMDRWRDDLDASLFRPGVSIDKATQVVMIFLEGLRARARDLSTGDPQVFAAMFAEVREYFELLKYGLYAAPPPAREKPE